MKKVAVRKQKFNKRKNYKHVNRMEYLNILSKLLISLTLSLPRVPYGNKNSDLKKLIKFK